jgi:hypothetical protein
MGQLLKETVRQNDLHWRSGGTLSRPAHSLADKPRGALNGALHFWRGFGRFTARVPLLSSFVQAKWMFFSAMHVELERKESLWTNRLMQSSIQ